MAVRGSILKAEIAKKIVETFPNSFLYNDGKEIRINGLEDGTPIQIKVTLTAAKTPVEQEAGIIIDNQTIPQVNSEKIPEEPSQDEKERLANLLNQLGL